MLQVKTISSKAQDVDTATRRVKIVISKMDEIDSDGDLITLSAYNKTIRERGPAGANLIYHLLDHKRNTLDALSLFTELYVENGTLIGISDIVKTQNGNDALALYEAGVIKQHSVGFQVVKSEPVTDNTARTTYMRISEIKLYEGSSVLWGANGNTPTLSVGKDEELAAIDYILKNGMVADATMIQLQLRKTFLSQPTQPEPSTAPEILTYFSETLKNIRI